MMVEAMAIRNRVERLEQETRFQNWLKFQRYLEYLSDDQLEHFVVFGFWRAPQPSEPPAGKCRVDSLSRKELIRLFEADERKRAKFAHRSDVEKTFFLNHAHWPEEACDECDCQQPWSDKLRAHYSRTTGTEGASVT